MKKYISVWLTLSFVFYGFCAAQTDTVGDTQPQIQTISVEPPNPEQDKISLKIIDSEGKSLTVESIEALAQLKPGSYKIKSWTLQRTDDNGDTWQLTARTAKGKITVVEGQTPKPELGEPIIASLKISKSSKGYRLEVATKAQLGENVEIGLNAKRANAGPVLRIWNEQKTYDERFTLSYG